MFPPSIEDKYDRCYESLDFHISCSIVIVDLFISSMVFVVVVVVLLLFCFVFVFVFFFLLRMSWICRGGFDFFLEI